MATWALGTASATAVAWFGVSSGIASVTATATGPALSKTGPVVGRPPALAPFRVTETTTSGPTMTSSPTSTPQTHSSLVPSGRTGGRTVTPSTSPHDGTTAASSPNPSSDTAQVKTAASTTTTTMAPPTTTSTPSQQSETFASKGGVATVTCDGQSVSFSASPNNGYQMRIDDPGPVSIHIEFVAGENNSEISATCVNGKPSGTVNNDN